MKKIAAVCLALSMLAFAALAAAATIETVEPIRIRGNLVITDYGFGIVKNGNVTKCGRYLDSSEAGEAEGWDGCCYFVITNEGSEGQDIGSIYVRGGTKYNWYWNWANVYIPANSSNTYWCTGYDTIAGFRGNWSVDFNIDRKHFVKKFTLSR